MDTIDHLAGSKVTYLDQNKHYHLVVLIPPPFEDEHIYAIYDAQEDLYMICDDILEAEQTLETL